MKTEEYLQYHKDVCDKLVEVTRRKNNDYAGHGNDDPFANFKLVETLNITDVTTGFLTRMSDKFARLITFSKKGELLVKDESVEDTLLDLANYCILLSGYLKSQKEDILPEKSGGDISWPTLEKVEEYADNYGYKLVSINSEDNNLVAECDEFTDPSGHKYVVPRCPTPNHEEDEMMECNAIHRPFAIGEELGRIHLKNATHYCYASDRQYSDTYYDSSRNTVIGYVSKNGVEYLHIRATLYEWLLPIKEVVEYFNNKKDEKLED